MNKKKKQQNYLEIPISFSGAVPIKSDGLDAMREAIDSGQFAFDIDLSNSDSGMSMTQAIYKDTFVGKFDVSLSEESVQVSLDGVFSMEYGDFEKETLPLPLRVKAYSVSDNMPDSYYFGEDENGIELLMVSEENVVKK